MYDELRCHYPLPVEGANAREYQTKDTPCQYLNHYEITADGRLEPLPLDIPAELRPGLDALDRHIAGIAEVYRQAIDTSYPQENNRQSSLVLR